MRTGKKHIKHMKNATFPCRELSCIYPAICRALCAAHYAQARRGVPLRLKYCVTEELQLVPWLDVSAPVPDFVELQRPKWEWTGNEQSLLDADEAAHPLEDSQSSEEKTTS
jgi:hypothetical protein